MDSSFTQVVKITPEYNITKSQMELQMNKYLHIMPFQKSTTFILFVFVFITIELKNSCKFFISECGFGWNMKWIVTFFLLAAYTLLFEYAIFTPTKQTIIAKI